jgi:hypothetical protein
MIEQTESQNLGRAGERWFQSMLPKEWIFQKPEEDIGLDGKIIIGSERKTGGNEFAVQIKASKSWDIKDGLIPVEGIKTDTISFWGSRLYPTLLVLFDEEKNTGYFGWVFDIIHHPIEFAYPSTRLLQKTVTLKISASSILTKDSFKQIKSDVDNYYIKFVNSLKGLHKTINILPTINQLTQAVRGLYLSHMQKPKAKDQEMMLGIMMVMSHREVIGAMDDLQKKYQLEIGTKDFVQYFIATYINEVNKIINDFDKIIYEEQTHAVWINPEAHQKNTPKLIDLIFDLMLILTDEEPKKRGEVFTFTE